MPKKVSKAVKAKIALEAIQGHHTVAEIASKYNVHPNFVTKAKKQAEDNFFLVFEDKEVGRIKELEKERDELLSLVGRKEQDNQWLKKKCKEMGLL